MDGDQSLKSNISSGGLNVLVVDDDIICLSIVAGILRTMKYEVVTVKNGHDALVTLQQRTKFFHLIVTDVHMPKMDGFEFQKKVREKFNIPVVMMSADDKEDSILRGLEAGAAFYIVKPVNYDDLRNLWQYAVSSRKVIRSVAAGKIRSFGGTSLVQKLSIDVDEESKASVKDQKKNKREIKSKVTILQVNEDNGKEKTEIVASKKTKVLWTTALHNRFLEAIRKLGLERAVPKRILETMDMPGLTRENVASHLQKYRIFLKHVTEACSSTGSSSGKNSLERTLRSSFAAGHPSLMIQALSPGFPQFMDHQQLEGISSLQPGFQMTNSTTPNHCSSVFPNQQASSTDFTPQLDQHRQLINSTNNQDYFQQKTPAGDGPTGNQIQGQFMSTNTTNNFTFFGEPVTKDSSLKQNIAEREISNDFNGRYGFLRNGDNGNMKLNSGYFPQEAYSSSGFSDVMQQDYIPMLGNVSLPKLSENGFDEVYLDQSNKPLYNEQKGGEAHNQGHTIYPNPMPQNPLDNQREWVGGISSYDFGNGMNPFDKYFLNFDQPRPNQDGTEDVMSSIFGPGSY